LNVVTAITVSVLLGLFGVSAIYLNLFEEGDDGDD